MTAYRPQMQDLMMEFVKLLRQRSTCQRAQQACVIADADLQRILAIGYNGKARGEEHECDSPVPGKCGCVHAEMNAIAKLRGEETKLVVFLTQSPCVLCARLLVNTGRVGLVLYLEPYRDATGIAILRARGIESAPWSNP